MDEPSRNGYQGDLPSGIPPFLFVVFGGTGDLTRKKLVPAFLRLLQDGRVAGGGALVAIGRRNLTDASFRSGIAASLPESSPDDAYAFGRHRDTLFYHTLDFLSDPDGFAALEESLRAREHSLGRVAGRLYYLAVPPDAFEPVVRELHRHGMLDEAHGYRRVLAEKPFGTDLASARALQAALTARVPEDRLYRIDHYLGKEMIRSLIGLRFSNRVFEPLWNGTHIDHVQISALETDGIGTRGGYYEAAGAMKDMLQSHLLQMLALVAMEPPVSLSSDAIRDAKVAALRCVRPTTVGKGGAKLVLGQYGAGTADGGPVPGYRDEALVARDSLTDTFAAMKATIPNARWEGVPFYLRAGKRLHRKGTWIAVQFKAPPTTPLYPELASASPDRLVVNVQPTEGYFFEVNTLARGRGFETERVRMDYCHTCRFGAATPLAYERLLADAAAGNPSLFVRWDELETAWSLVDSLAASVRDRTKALGSYAAGTPGPDAARRLIEADGRTWWEPET